MTTPILELKGLCKSFGGLHAVQQVSLQLLPGDRKAIIGPNGAGKTTLINLLTGVLAPTSGDVFLNEQRITAFRQHARVKRGLARTFQINALFPGLTVLESVLLAILERKGLGAHWWSGWAARLEEIDEAKSLLARLRLERDAHARTGRLPYGRQRLVEIALALASGPTTLLLDEPAAGIASAESVEILGAIAALPREVTVLFIEHDMGLVFRFAERITVLVGGRILTEGTPAEIAADERVKAVYLGRERG